MKSLPKGIQTFSRYTSQKSLHLKNSFAAAAAKRAKIIDIVTVFGGRAKRLFVPICGGTIGAAPVTRAFRKS